MKAPRLFFYCIRRNQLQKQTLLNRFECLFALLPLAAVSRKEVHVQVITPLDFKQHQETPIARYVYKGREIAEMTDVEANYSLKYYYNNANKVSCYWESADGKTGFAADVSYPDESQTIYRTYGADCLQNTSDDILTSYLFDYAGRTVNAYTTDASGKLLGATNAVYSGSGSTDKTNNRTLRTASMGESGTELLKNGTISGSGNWDMGDGASMTTSVSRDSSGGAIQIKGNWKNQNGNAWQDVSLRCQRQPAAFRDRQYRSNGKVRLFR